MKYVYGFIMLCVILIFSIVLGNLTSNYLKKNNETVKTKEHYETNYLEKNVDLELVYRYNEFILENNKDMADVILTKMSKLPYKTISGKQIYYINNLQSNNISESLFKNFCLETNTNIENIMISIEKEKDKSEYIKHFNVQYEYLINILENNYKDKLEIVLNSQDVFNLSAPEYKYIESFHKELLEKAKKEYEGIK